MTFDLHIGIDYSGRETPTSRTPTLQVYAATGGEEPQQVHTPAGVAKSTHAGIPWLRRIRQAVGDKVHFWPFDGWSVPEGKSVIAEIYPSVFTKRYSASGRTPDQQAAYAVARWLSDCDRHGFLERYFNPPLTPEDRKVADLEGWILGIC